MRTFSINTLGCKVNQYEGQQIRELLENRGLRQAEWPQPPDLAVVHTCCVTHTASAKSRQCIRKVLKHSPQSLILVCGCLPAAQTGELSCFSENVHLVSNRSDLAAALTHWTQRKPNTTIKAKNAQKIKHKNEPENESELPLLTSFAHQTRAYLKVQDGCDGYCSYCIVPRTRPIVRSKPLDAALFEAKTLVQSGHKEIVVSGVFLGAYGRKTVRRRNWPDRMNDNLADLLERLAQIPGLERIRLSSLEPADVTEPLLDTFCKHRNIMPHLHLPLQSGSDKVLARMCRQYRLDDFKRTVDSLRTRLDRPAITTDIMVGFPGETDADFEQTLELARFVGFAKMHVFMFSPRRRTAAADMPDRIERAVCKERSQILRQLDVELGRRFRGQFIGETAEVLIEPQAGRPDWTDGQTGRSQRYFQVFLDARCSIASSQPESRIENRARQARLSDQVTRANIVRVRLIENLQDGMVGVVNGDF